MAGSSEGGTALPGLSTAQIIRDREGSGGHGGGGRVDSGPVQRSMARPASPQQGRRGQIEIDTMSITACTLAPAPSAAHPAPPALRLAPGKCIFRDDAFHPKT
ncbi:hypothetical protein RR46_02469 [Papilio xuthus]|uniref:Uncharacterized protein n=1 Tax=Papilio xuthus TaxID=66420 RepID=A0A194QGY7_PAPXU|nr:hypothetical protein RR46_02469 [Papilio xuthus]